MSWYFVKTPRLLRWVFYKYHWRIQKTSNTKKVLYLSFDDGPTPEITDWTLDTLKAYNAQGTFFCIGKNIVKSPKLFERILKEGHAVGNHTHKHLNGWKTSIQSYVDSVLQTEALITKYCILKIEKPTEKTFQHNNLKLFRPPYGKIRSNQAKYLLKKGYAIVMWDVLSADFDQHIQPEKCLQNVMDNINSGSIIIFHDSVKAARNLKYALPEVLKKGTAMGYEFKRIALPNG